MTLGFFSVVSFEPSGLLLVGFFGGNVFLFQTVLIFLFSKIQYFYSQNYVFGTAVHSL